MFLLVDILKLPGSSKSMIEKDMQPRSRLKRTSRCRLGIVLAVQVSKIVSSIFHQKR